MRLRRQLPVHSPLTLGAIFGAIRGSRGEQHGIEERLAATIRETYAAREVVLTNSGTSALTLALAALGRAGRAPVALPAYACFDIATAAVGANVDVILYDVDPDTLGPAQASLRAALAAGARSIVVAYLYGYPVDFDAVSALAAEYDAIIIEDAAQGAGGTWNGVPLGSFGAASILSFGRGKGTTGGGGGALLWRKRAADVLGPAPRVHAAPAGRAARAAVATAAQWVLARPSVYALPSSLPFLGLGDTVYKAPSPPAAVSRFSRALVAQTLRLSSAEVAARRTHAARLLTSVARPSTSVRAPQEVAGGKPGYLRLPLVVEPSRMAQFTSRRARHLGIMPGYPLPLDRLEQWQPSLRRTGAALQGAAELAHRLFTLPTHSMLSESELRALEALLLE